MKDRKAYIVGVLSALVMFITLAVCGLFLASDPLLHEAISFSMTATDVAAIYPLPFSSRVAFDRAERAMFDLLDPFSYRLNARDFEQMREEYSGEYSGVGISVMPRDSGLLVMSVREGGPADSGGVQSGDIILAVDGETIPVQDPSLAIGQIRGPSGTKVALHLYRSAIHDTLTLVLVRSTIKLEHLSYHGLTRDSVAYIRIADFESGAAEELKDAVEDLEAKNPVGYILDLKGNPGGYLNEAISAADLFLDEGSLIVGTRGRSRWKEEKFFASEPPLTKKPIVILTDRGTASAAEIMTGALRGSANAVVVGDTTFGKGLVQSVYSLPNQSAIRLTISRYFFADGRFLNPPDSALVFSGLAPDLYFEDKVDVRFRNLILSGFLLYDFVDEYQERLSQQPPQLGYPDEIVNLFAKFARERNVQYRSRMSEILDFARLDNTLGKPETEISELLDDMAETSRRADSNVFRRNADFLKYQIRRLAVEKMLGRKESYRLVIVPGRKDIRLAGEILLDPAKFEQLRKKPSSAEPGNV